MVRRSRWLWIPPACLVVLALSFGAAGAADTTKVDQATKRVEQGAKFSGNTIGEFFKKTFGS